MLANDSRLFNLETLLPSRAKSAALINTQRNYDNLVHGTNSFSEKKSYDDEYYTPRREANNAFDSDSGYLQKSYLDLKKPSVYDIVRAKNTSERLDDLERTNLKLRRMLQYSSVDKLNALDSARVLETDRSIRSNLNGPPTLRQGRIGSSWRHIKQTNNYTNSNLLFIDGTVRIDDSSRFPPRLYGYPPKMNTPRENALKDRSHEMLGLGAKSLSSLDLPVNNIVKNRPLNLAPYENKYSNRAKEGFEYWTKDKRYPENNKPKEINATHGIKLGTMQFY